MSASRSISIVDAQPDPPAMTSAAPVLPTMLPPEEFEPLWRSLANDKSLALVEERLGAGLDPKARGSLRAPNGAVTGGFTLLMAAAAGGAAAAVARLLPLSDPSATTDEGETALHFAVSSRSMGAIRRLLPVSDPNATSTRRPNTTPLLRAMNPSDDEAKDERRIRLLLDAGADPSVRGIIGRTPFHIALSVRNAAAVRALAPVSDVMATDDTGSSAWAVAVELGTLHNRWDLFDEAGAFAPARQARDALRRHGSGFLPKTALNLAEREAKKEAKALRGALRSASDDSKASAADPGGGAAPKRAAKLRSKPPRI
jgi:ankyrin repeat protein